MAAGRPVFTADYYAVDGASGKVSAFVDWNDPTHTLAQATSANQVAIPAAHADFAGKLCANFTGSERYQSNKDVWKPMHDGTGSTCCCVFTATSVSGFGTWCATTTVGGGPTQLGFVLGRSATDGRWQVGNGTSTVFQTSPADGYVVDIPTYRDVSYSETAGTKRTYRVKGTITSSGGTSAAPSSSNPVGRLMLAASTAGTSAAAMRWRSLVFLPFQDTGAAGRTLVQQWIQQDTGIGP